MSSIYTMKALLAVAVEFVHMLDDKKPRTQPICRLIGNQQRAALLSYTYICSYIIQHCIGNMRNLYIGFMPVEYRLLYANNNAVVYENNI